MQVQLRGWVVVLAAMLAGCGGASSREVYLPDGTKGYNIACDSTMGSLSDCFQKAGEICGAKGYTLVASQAGLAVTRALFIKCRD